MKLSVVIPAHDEEAAIGSTVRLLGAHLTDENIEYEILVINDHSTDSTEQVLSDLARTEKGFRYLNNPYPSGFGLAVRCGLEQFTGDVVAVFMADASDSPDDLVRFYRALVSEGVDCVFGSRFIQGGVTTDYPWPKLILNRFANQFIRLLLGIPYNDVTNAFKMYRKEVIAGLHPILSHHFNLTVELPLKAIIRGYSYIVLPNSWINRKTGESKLKIKEMGARYLFVVLYCLIEKWLSMGDYRAKGASENPHAGFRRYEAKVSRR
jgi:dolichol-phosphate mannosyltransferase